MITPTNSISRMVCLAFVLIAIGAEAAAAQQAPQTNKFTGTVTGSVSLESGVTNLNGVELEMEGAKPYSAKGVVEGRFSYAYSTTKPADSAVRSIIEERFEGVFDVEHNLKPSIVAMARTEYVRDLPGSIEHRWDEMLGIGPVMGNNRVQVRVLPGVSLFSQNVRLPSIDGYHTFYGFLQDSRVNINQSWTFNQSFIWQRLAGNVGDYYYEGEASLTGAITRVLGLQLRYEYRHENLLPPGVNRRYQKIMTGIQVKF